jgi:hypothetical protein
VVADDFKGQGLTEIEGLVLTHNPAMLEPIRGLGFQD